MISKQDRSVGFDAFNPRTEARTDFLHRHAENLCFLPRKKVNRSSLTL
jgi:hypothetical protein